MFPFTDCRRIGSRSDGKVRPVIAMLASRLQRQSFSASEESKGLEKVEILQQGVFGS